MPYKDPAKRATAVRDYHRRQYKERRAAWFAENGPCVNCGSRAQLEVDHLDPGVKISSRMWNWSAERLAAELANCQVLCRPCHVTKTAAERWKGHGASLYSNGRCRCEVCRKGEADRRRAYRRRLGAVPREDYLASIRQPS